MSTEAVIFDLDNTLLNRKRAFEVYSDRFIDQYVAVDCPSRRSKIKEYVRLADRDGYRRKRDFYDDVRRNLPMKNIEIGTDEMMQFWFSEFPKCTVLMDGAMRLLEQLNNKRNIRLGIITNGAAHTQHAKIDQAGIRPYFDCIVVSDEVGVKKPDRRIFDIALERINVPSHNTWFVGDHPRNDVHGAREAGLQTVWLEGFMEWDTAIEPSKHTITELDQILPIIEKKVN